MRQTKNLTLAIDADLVRRARILAARRDTSLTGLIREHLEELVRREDEAMAARDRLLRSMDERPLAVGDARWTREELHER